MSDPKHSLNTLRIRTRLQRLGFMDNGCDWEDHLEDPGRYRIGGYHPVHIGDELDSGRYRVIHKLSHGEYGTVWLCIDQNTSGAGPDPSPSSDSSTTPSYVAVKILQVQELDHDGDRFIKTAIENCRKGPNRDEQDLSSTSSWAWLATRRFTSESRCGTHECLVYPVLGPSVRAAINIFGSGNVAALQRIARLATAALNSMHKLEICHGDFKPSNICLQLKPKSFDMSAEELLKHLGEPKREALFSWSGREDETLEPEYLVYPVKYTQDHASMIQKQIMIMDFGRCYPQPDLDSDQDSDADSGLGSGPGSASGTAQSSSRSSESDSSSSSGSDSSSDSGLAAYSSIKRHGLQIPASYASPEAAKAALFIDEIIDCASDCWSLGCVIYELRLGTPLFEQLQLPENAPSSPRSYLVKICDVLGELPQELVAEHKIPLKRRWTTATGEKAVIKGREACRTWPPDAWERLVWHETVLERIKALGGKKCPAEMRVSTIQRHIQKTARETEKPMTEEEAADLADLLEKLLRYDPEERITAGEALNHRWFRSKYGAEEDELEEKGEL